MDIITKITACLVSTLPVVAIGFIGIGGLCLSEYIFLFFKFLLKRRIIGKANQLANKKQGKQDRRLFEKTAKNFKKLFDNELDLNKKPKQALVKKRSLLKKSTYIKSVSEVAAYLPIKKIENGIIYTTDNRYVKIIEVTPINFLFRNAKEQRSIIYAFVSFLKISPVKVQFKSLSKKADINKFLDKVDQEIAKESDPSCHELQYDYKNLLCEIGTTEAVSRRFFAIFEYEPPSGRVKNEESEAIMQLETLTRRVRTYLNQCGNEIIEHQDENNFTIEALYNILNRRESFDTPLSQRKKDVCLQFDKHYGRESIKDIPATEFIAPKYIDFSHINYIKIDGEYTCYLLISANGFNERVFAGWTSGLINAGE